MFRGKRIDGGGWLEGYHAVIGKHEVIIAFPEMYYDENAKERYGNEINDVDPETVGQYTGLDDKNGKKTFKGDIFQASDGDHILTYIIAWDEDALGWSAECVEDPDGTLPLSEFKIEGIEIIGNIFDDPGLIERDGAAG